jgi:predicted O-linked N-acetylglucosamine transferase (SPINDLY family)
MGVFRKLLNRLVSAGPAAVDAARPGADGLIAEGRRAEQSGDLALACRCYRDAVALAPDYPAAHLNLGVGLEAAGDGGGALRCYEAVLGLDPVNAVASYNLGKLYFVRRAFPQAERFLRAALVHKPDFAEARVVLANLLDAQGDHAAAAIAFEAAARQRPEDFGTWFRYGQVLLELQRAGEAEFALMRAISLDPASADAHGTLAGLYQERHDFAAAVPHLEAALKHRPDWAVGFFSYAHALLRLRRFEEAEAALVRAIEIEPGREDLYQARMNVMERRGRIGEMLELCRARRALFPDRTDYQSTELFALNFVAEISAEEHFARHKTFGEQVERSVPLRFSPFGNERDPERPLRVGYFSGEFHIHPVGRFMLPLIERHDRSRAKVYCYSVSIFPPDPMTHQLKAVADAWRDGSAMKDRELADLIHQDQIDILVDLSGHSGVSRLPVFAHQPAPVQVTWLGNLNTTGLTRVQYRITDRNCDPPGLTEHLYTEKLVRLPNSQWCYRPSVGVTVPSAAPVESTGGVTFGSFTQFAKLTASTRSLWARILREALRSRLIMAGVPEGAGRTEFLQALALEGVDSSRIVLLPMMPMDDYMRAFGEVDIALDSAPYSGGTTTCDALWMGVPVLTVPGLRPASRSAASVLATVGLPDWIAQSPDDYVRRAVAFAEQPEMIAQLRRTLRKRMAASPLMQEERFARDIEQAYRAMWRRWCSGERR